MWSLFILCLPIGCVIGGLVVARHIAALFSEKSRRLVRERFGTHLFLLALASVLFLMGFYAPLLPPAWVERRSQREFVFTNIEAAGGWRAFKKECDTLISQSRTSGHYQWFRHGEALPASCAILCKLHPLEVRVVPQGETPAYVQIEVFFMLDRKSV